MIKDSGCRSEFDTGAVRDVQVGKGKPSYMPLEVAANLFDVPTGDNVLRSIAGFRNTLNTRFLYDALMFFARDAYCGSKETMLLDVAIHYEEGCAKYGPDNWRKGIPWDAYIDSAVRHYLKWRRNDQDEPHNRALVWNLLSCIWEIDYHEEDTDSVHSAV